MSDAWFARPVLHVTDVAASVRYYVDKLGFATPWHYDDAGATVIAQVERDGCALILSSQWPDKVGNGLVFVSMTTEPTAAQHAALDALRAEFEANGAAVKSGEWGYKLVVVDDPDGNQLYFNYNNA